MKSTTFVMMTCGEETEKECLQAITPFLGDVEFFEVRNVYPQVVALNQMISRVQTEFFVPVDSDIILDADAWPRIKNAISKNQHSNQWHSILFSLWDELTDKKILALKVLRSKIAKENMFSETATPDVEHYQRLTNLGYYCVHDYIKQKPIGKHIVRGHHFCYNKYRDVYQTYRNHNFEWDSGVFMGGHDLRSRAKAHFDFFVLKHLETNNSDYLSCIAGMADGITSVAENKSKTLESKKYAVSKETAIDHFMNWYLSSIPTTGSMIF